MDFLGIGLWELVVLIPLYAAVIFVCKKVFWDRSKKR